MKPIKLTWKQVRANCIKYLKRGKLQCQHPELNYPNLYGSPNNIRCAIGASFTDNQIRRIKKIGENESSIDQLFYVDIITASRKILPKLKNLQMAHDNSLEALNDFLKSNK